MSQVSDSNKKINSERSQRENPARQNSFSIIAPSDKNGVGFVLSSHIVSKIQNSHVAREFGLVLLDMEGERVLLLNWHLPDDTTLHDRKYSLQNVFERLEVVLNSWWTSTPWSHLLVCGDFNTMHPGDVAVSSCKINRSASQ